MEAVLLAIHALWILWMISGVAIAILGFWHDRLWNMTIFRTSHVLGIAATATVPIWNDGRCPMTEWESATGGRPLDPLLARALEAVVYWDVSPVILSLVTAVAAILTVTIYFRHPPSSIRQLHRSKSEVGRQNSRGIGRG